MDAAVIRRLVDIVGAAHCLMGSDRGPFVVEGRTPAAVVFPGSVDEAAAVVRTAAGAHVPVIPWGGGTAMSLGAPPPDGALVVATRRLARLVEHEPGDLTVTVEAGSTLEALQTALGQRGQWLPLDPPQPARATVGGVLATNAAGPRRHGYGTARDLVLGVRVIGADGALVKAGGKVVKNVAGYDLAKLYIGALGTLGLVVDVTLKLRPRPEAEEVVAAAFADISGAARAAAALLGTPLSPHAVELTAPAAGHAAVPAGAAALLVGFDGLPATVGWQGDEAARLLRGAGATDVHRLPGPAGEAALAAPRDLAATTPNALAVAEAGVPPADVGDYLGAAQTMARTNGLHLGASAHAGEGILTLVLAAQGKPDGRAAIRVLAALRERARAGGGHLTLQQAPLGVKEAVGAWDPPGPALGLMRALKARLDPQGVLNPGRFVGGL